jgi:hypothetical protein
MAMSTLTRNNKPVEIWPVVNARIGSEPTCEKCFENDATAQVIFERESTYVKERYCDACLPSVVTIA